MTSDYVVQVTLSPTLHLKKSVYEDIVKFILRLTIPMEPKDGGKDLEVSSMTHEPCFVTRPFDGSRSNLYCRTKN